MVQFYKHMLYKNDLIAKIILNMKLSINLGRA